MAVVVVLVVVEVAEKHVLRSHCVFIYLSFSVIIKRLQ